MKVIPIALATDYDANPSYIATALKITRLDGQVFGFTSHDITQTVNGVSCLADPGLDASSVSSQAGFSVGNLELSALHDNGVFTIEEIMRGLWRGASFELFRYDWRDPSDGVDVLMSGPMGEMEQTETKIIAELRDLRQYLQQPVGNLSSKNCRYRFGNFKCGVDLVSYTFITTLTAVTDNQTFRDASIGQIADFFGEGRLRWTGGNNIGARVKIRDFAADGTYTLVLPMFSPVQVGDTAEVIGGCRLRVEDCKRHNNILNYGGEPHRNTTNNIVAVPSV